MNSMASPNPRKRPAPGSAPAPPMQSLQQPYAMPQDHILGWNPTAVLDNNTFMDPSSNVNSFVANAQQSQSQNYHDPSPTASTALARRQNNNRSLVPSGPRVNLDPSIESWGSYNEEGALVQTAPNTVEGNDNIEVLEDRAARAKKDAQAKRKPIPPFVQKLSSFLEEQKNTDLIRWSEKGDSFIVLDEDEFAKTLIPELFKHNNYASFVRQLNMYGFHKRVGLSDNSMKASERKNKSPSEYYNPFFKRGHPNLLWLISKPKTGSKGKKSKDKDADVESDEELGNEGDNVQSVISSTNYPQRALPANEVAPLPKKDMQRIREEISSLQHGQRTISGAISRLRGEHVQLVNQAKLFQTQHDRHENSINAILNFLANVFRKSLEDQGGQSVAEFLANILPNGQIPQGSVVDLGDYVQQATPAMNSMSPPKRPQRLLPAPPAAGQPGQVQSHGLHQAYASPSPTPAHNNNYQGPQPGSITEVFDTPADNASPDYFKQELQANPQEGMMKLINDANAGNQSSINLAQMAANTSVNLSQDQRSKMLSMMSQRASDSPVSRQTSAAPNRPPSATPGASVEPTSAPSNTLSPSIANMSPAIPPSIEQYNQRTAEIEELERLQEEQKAKLEELVSQLGPLSPSGHIPGIDENGVPTWNDYMGGNLDGSNVDYAQFLDPDAFSGTDPNFLNADNHDDFNFSLDPVTSEPLAKDFVGGRVIESQSNSNTPSPAGTEEVTLNHDLERNPGGTAKRRRMG